MNDPNSVNEEELEDGSVREVQKQQEINERRSKWNHAMEESEQGNSLPPKLHQQDFDEFNDEFFNQE